MTVPGDLREGVLAVGEYDENKEWTQTHVFAFFCVYELGDFEMVCVVGFW